MDKEFQASVDESGSAGDITAKTSEPTLAPTL